MQMHSYIFFSLETLIAKAFIASWGGQGIVFFVLFGVFVELNIYPRNLIFHWLSSLIEPKNMKCESKLKYIP